MFSLLWLKKSCSIDSPIQPSQFRFPSLPSPFSFASFLCQASWRTWSSSCGIGWPWSCKTLHDFFAFFVLFNYCLLTSSTASLDVTGPFSLLRFMQSFQDISHQFLPFSTTTCPHQFTSSVLGSIMSISSTSSMNWSSWTFYFVSSFHFTNFNTWPFTVFCPQSCSAQLIFWQLLYLSNFPEIQLYLIFTTDVKHSHQILVW